MGQSNLRRYALLAVFSLAQFLDTFNNAALFPAVPAIAADLHIASHETAWLFAAYQATFAAFLLIVSG
jgi:MFS family permease